MHSAYRFLLPVLPATILALALLAGPCTAALSDHPVVYGISGPEWLNDAYGPTGLYTFTATVSGGSPPYSYKWMNPPGIKTLFEGNQYSTVQVPPDQIRVSGPGNYGIWLTVTDSAGKDALWERPGGTGSSNQFGYFLSSDGKAWTKKTEPASFPKPAGREAVAAATTADTCVDSGARFSGVNGQVEISREGKPGDTIFAKIDTVLCEGDTIKTAEDATCLISFTDMSTFAMKPESEIILAKTKKGESKLKMVAGNMWINLKTMIKDGSMTVDMDQAVAGIKGTTLVCSTDGTRSTTQVIEGTVEVTGRSDGKKTPVTTGQQVTATATGLGTPASFNVAAVQADWDAVKANAAAGSPAQRTMQKSPAGLVPVLSALAGAVALLAVRRT